MTKTYIYVTPYFPAANSWRGAYSLDFVRAIKIVNPNIRVEVFVPGEGSDYVLNGINVWRFKERKLPSDIFPFLFRRYNERSFMAALKRAKVDVNDVSICHGNTAEYSIYPLAVKKLNSNIRTILHHHDLQSFGLNGGVLRHFWLYNLIMFPVLRKVHEQIDIHVFISEASKRSFLAAPNTDWTTYSDYKHQMRCLPYRSTRIRSSLILHNGVDTSLFNSLARKSVETRSDKFIIGCVGNFEKLKGQLTLIKAVEKIVVRQCKRVEVRFVGSGPMLSFCKKYASTCQSPSSFVFLPEMKHEKLPEFYQSIHLFVLPSVFEGFGCVYTEAWACGTPFIGCKGQGIEDVLDDDGRAMWLAAAFDVDDLAEKILFYMNNRPTQFLACEIDILRLSKRFIGEVNLR